MKVIKVGGFVPRAIDRAVFGIFAVLNLSRGVYLIGPLYLDETVDGTAPLLVLFNSHHAVIIFGILLIIDGLLLGYACLGKSRHKAYTQVTEIALLSGFLLRLYSLIGTFIIIEDWRPPNYLPHAATVCVLGAYWVWIKVNERPIR